MPRPVRRPGGSRECCRLLCLLCWLPTVLALLWSLATTRGALWRRLQKPLHQLSCRGNQTAVDSPASGPKEAAVPAAPQPPDFAAECLRSFPAYEAFGRRKFGNRTFDPESAVKDKVVDVEYAMELDVRNASVTFGRKRRVSPQMNGRKFFDLEKYLAAIFRRRSSTLAPLLRQLGGRLPLCFRSTDAPICRHNEGLPLHGFSSDPGHTDVPLPDFTFQEYPEIGSVKVNSSWKENSWRAVQARLRAIRQDKQGFVWRGRLDYPEQRRLLVQKAAKVLPRLRVLMSQLAPDGINVNGSGQGRLSLYEQCRWAFTFYVPGYHYSASLKYKFACGQTVLFIQDKAHSEEFFYAALRDGVNVYFVRPDLEDLWEVMERALLRAQQGVQVGAAARELAETYLSQRGVDCYVVSYLTRHYIPLVRETWLAWERAHGKPRSAFYGTMQLSEDPEKAERPNGRFECDSP